MTTYHIVVWQSAIKRIQARRELSRNVVHALRRIWRIEAAVIVHPVFVPGALMSGSAFIFGSLTDPENRGHDIRFPWKLVTNGRPRPYRNEHLRLDLQNRLLAKLLRVLLEAFFGFNARGRRRPNDFARSVR